jgi:hypothetical protein
MVEVETEWDHEEEEWSRGNNKKNKKEEHDRDSLNRGSRGRDYGNNNRYR